MDIPHVDGVEHRWIDIGPFRMHVAEAGAGEPLVLLHGWPQHWYEWRYMIGPLAEHYRVICPDLRGLGWSDAPPGPYDKETLADDIVRLLDALELDRVRLIGHDWGGFVGFLLCLLHPERVERFVSLNIIHPWQRPSLRSLANAWRPAHAYLISAPWVGGWVLRNQPAFVRTALRLGTVNRSVWTDEDLAAFSEPLREPARAAATVALYRTFVTREARAMLAGRYRSMRLTTPTLIIFGERDVAISKSALDGYEPYADDMRVELVPDAGHFIAEEKPELVTERALEFFSTGP